MWYMDMTAFVFHEDYVAAAYAVHFMYVMMFVTDYFLQIGQISDAIKTSFSSFCCVCACIHDDYGYVYAQFQIIWNTCSCWICYAFHVGILDYVCEHTQAPTDFRFYGYIVFFWIFCSFRVASMYVEFYGTLKIKHVYIMLWAWLCSFIACMMSIDGSMGLHASKFSVHVLPVVYEHLWHM